jgi:hypothetical protein
MSVSNDNWTVVGFYCDGPEDDARRHEALPIKPYRRMVHEDGTWTWAPLYSSNDGPGDALRDVRTWLDPADQVVSGGMGSNRAVETFNCPECGFNLPRRFEDVAKVLDAAYAVGWTRVTLRQWAARLR